MAFSICVEMLNLRARRRGGNPVRLHQKYVEAGPGAENGDKP
jgi:hypothetical protein